MLVELLHQLAQKHRQTMVVSRDAVKTRAQLLEDSRRNEAVASTLEAVKDDWPYLMEIAGRQKGLPILLTVSAATGIAGASPKIEEQPGSRADVR